MQVRVVKLTNQVARFCVHAKDKEIYIEKRHLEKRNPWKITSRVNCGLPSSDEFNEIIRQIEGYLTPKKSRYSDWNGY